jgi:hypothetical protein
MVRPKSRVHAQDSGLGATLVLGRLIKLSSKAAPLRACAKRTELAYVYGVIQRVCRLGLVTH